MLGYIKAAGIFLAISAAVAVLCSWKAPYSFTFAWILNFMLMAGVLFFTQSINPKLSSAYYNTQKWEANGTIYKWVGVNVYRKILVWVGWEKLNKAANPVKNTSDSLIHLERTSRQAEFGHLVIFFVVLGFNIFVALKYGLSKSVWLFTLNIALNIYPIFVQRYNRPRLQRAIALQKSLREA